MKCLKIKSTYIDYENKNMLISIESDIKYEGFIDKQKEEIKRNLKLENTIIPEDFSL